MSEHNRDNTIEVGDKVRVICPRSAGDAGYEFIVAMVDGGDIWDSWPITVPTKLFWPEELEIMEPKAALESVHAEREKLEEDHKKAYDMLKEWHTKKYMEPVVFGKQMKELFG